MMGSSRILMDLSWGITALGSLHAGLLAMGYDLLAHPMLMSFGKILGYGFGIFGAISLVMFVGHLMGACSCAHCCNGK
jgi:hypothetical protein